MTAPSSPAPRPPATRAELQELLDLSFAKGRRAQGRCLIEGPVLLAEALAAGHVPSLVLMEEGLDERLGAVVDAAERAGARVALLTGKQARKLSDRGRAPGLLAAMPLPKSFDWDTAAFGADDPALVVLLCGLQDPGNVGTLVRSARAFGATALLHLMPTGAGAGAGAGTGAESGSGTGSAAGADPLGPKALRSSAGAALRLPLAATTLEQALADAARHGLRPACAVPPEPGHGDAPTSPPSMPPAAPPAAPPARCLLLLGHETQGVPALSDAVRLTVPQDADVESLNVSMAGSILMADWYRAHRSRPAS